MDKQQFDELAGRIEAMGRAMLRLTAELEMERVIDGPRVSAAWRQAVPEQLGHSTLLDSARSVLQDMAAQLDEARAARQARRP